MSRWKPAGLLHLHVQIIIIQFIKLCYISTIFNYYFELHEASMQWSIDHKNSHIFIIVLTTGTEQSYWNNQMPFQQTCATQRTRWVNMASITCLLYGCIVAAFLSHERNSPHFAMDISKKKYFLENYLYIVVQISSSLKFVPCSPLVQWAFVQAIAWNWIGS